MLNAQEIELLVAVRDCPPKLRAKKIEQVARLLNCAPGTVYAKLKDPAVGFISGRKKRSTAGMSVKLPVDLLRLISGVIFQSADGHGRPMPIRRAMEIVRASLRQQGKDFPLVHASTVSRQLKQHNLHFKQLSLPSAAKRLSSNGPNHVWQFDSTTSVLYYFSDEGVVLPMEAAAINKNKLANLERLVKSGRQLLTRYVVVDHASGNMKMRYMLGGESAQNLIEFLVWAMCKQARNPMHGIPEILMGDRGPGNTSQLFKTFCSRLGIQRELHAPGNARATGSVEKHHDLARMHLESRYRFQETKRMTLDELNAQAEEWTDAYCSREVHTRHGMTRSGCWMKIRPEQLRVPASEELLCEAASSAPEQARVDNTKCIRHRGRIYNLSSLPSVVAGLKVTFQRNVYRSPNLDVLVSDPQAESEVWQEVAPDEVNEFGFDGQHVIGEGYKGVPLSVVDRNRERLQREAYRTGDGLPTQEEAAKLRKQHAAAYAGVIDPMADVKATQLPIYMPRQGTKVELPQRQVEARRYGHYEAAKMIKERTGAAYTPQVYPDLVARWPDGMNEAQIEQVCAELTSQPAADGAERAMQGL